MSNWGLNSRQWVQITLAGVVWSVGFFVAWFDWAGMRPFGLLILMGAGTLASREERRRWTRPVNLKRPVMLTFLFVMGLVVFVALFMFFERDLRTAAFWHRLEPVYPWLGLALYLWLLPHVIKRWRGQLLSST